MNRERFHSSAQCLPSPQSFPMIRGTVGRYLARPWFDALALRLVVNYLFPLNRALQTSIVCKGDAEGFENELELKHALPKSCDDALTEICIRHYVAKSAFERWKVVMFGDGLSIAGRIFAELRRQETSQRLLESALMFKDVRKLIEPIKWDLPTPKEFHQHYDGHSDDPAKIYSMPKKIPLFHMSHSIHGVYGREYWLRYQSFFGGENWVRCFEPLRGLEPSAPTLIFLQGLGVEQDCFQDREDPVCALTEAGFRVLRIQQPGHGFRKTPGRFAGEEIFSRGPIGLVDTFQQWISDIASLVHWTRTQRGGAVVLGGVSLGALTSQLYSSVSWDWPDKLKPDGLLLIGTSGNVLDVLRKSCLTEGVGLPEKLDELGWQEADFLRCSPLVQPSGYSVVPPDKIIFMLGQADNLMPYKGGLELADRWRVPPENRFLRNGKGHFSLLIDLIRDPIVLRRLAEITKID
ncbi:alpha/beta hydrolase [Kiloniella antarctica]|uniref:Alpha/beta hydrolase n=1 Tax=Kiloniella antarctica TaxID=1550907 RepID=A0ABW5BEQ5_9PROT